MSVPDAYFGSWSVDKNENFDEFLEAKNVPWIARKAILLAGHNITFTNLGNGRYRAEHKVMDRFCTYEFCLGEEFEIKGLDGVQDKLTVVMEGANLVEFHTKQDKPNQPVDKQVYSMQEGKLVQCFSDGKISCKRYYKRKN